jgi:hypothetical protein
MVAIAEWLDHHGVGFSLLDCDTENKSKGSVLQYFPERCRKIDIRKPTGLDAFIEEAIDSRQAVVVADLGAGSGQDAHQWFDSMYDQIEGLGMEFVGAGVITANPASVETVFRWATGLKERVEYLIVRNLKDGEEIEAFDSSEEGEIFQQVFVPEVVTFEARLPELQNSLENHGATISSILSSPVPIGELTKTAAKIRLRGYRNRCFAQLDSVRDLLVPSALAPELA